MTAPILPGFDGDAGFEHHEAILDLVTRIIGASHDIYREVGNHKNVSPAVLQDYLVTSGMPTLTDLVNELAGLIEAPL